VSFGVVRCNNLLFAKVVLRNLRDPTQRTGEESVQRTGEAITMRRINEKPCMCHSASTQSDVSHRNSTYHYKQGPQCKQYRAGASGNLSMCAARLPFLHHHETRFSVLALHCYLINSVAWRFLTRKTQGKRCLHPQQIVKTELEPQRERIRKAVWFSIRVKS